VSNTYKAVARLDIPWSNIESLLISLGAEIYEGRGSRVRVALNDVRAVFHRPHPDRVTNKGAVKSVRRFLHAYPDVAHTTISLRVHVQDSPMYPCRGARKSVALPGPRFSAHYRKPLMARISD